MNIYLLLFLILHGIAFVAMGVNVIIQHGHVRRLQAYTTVKNTKWFNNLNRSEIVRRRSILNLILTVVAEATCLWLLWMAGAFTLS